MRTVVVDSSIWIDWGRGGFQRSEFNKKPVRFLLVAPVLAELENGRWASTSQAQVEDSIRLIAAAKKFSEFVALDEAAALEFGYLRAVTGRTGRTRGSLDLMIAAIARVRRAEVLTRDASANFPELLALPPRPID